MSESVYARKLEDMDDLDENTIANDPWSQLLLSTMLKLTKKAVLNWLSIIRKIGETPTKNNEYGNLLIDNVTNFYEELILDMDMIREKIVDKLVRTMQMLDQICKDLQISIPQVNYEDKPLASLLNELETNLAKYQEMINDRVKIIQDFNNQTKSLCNEFGRTPNLLTEKSPLPTLDEIDDYQQFIKQLEMEKLERIKKFNQFHHELINLSNDLDYDGRTNFERFILSKTINDHDYHIVIKDKEIEKIANFHNDLSNMKIRTFEENEQLREQIVKLWNILEYDIYQRDLFLTKHNKLTSLKTLQHYRNELNRCELLKKENIKKFVLQQRNELHELWLKCNLTEQQQQEFKFFFSNCYTEDLFDLHTCEINKWQQYYDENQTILIKLDEYRELWQEFTNLQLKYDNKDRYKNRGGQLLIEEKIRNKLTKKLKKLENDLNDYHHNYIENNRRPFLTFGQQIPEYLQTLQHDLEQKSKEKLSARKMEREKTTTTTTSITTKSRINLFPSTSNLLGVSPSPIRTNIVKRKLLATPRIGDGGGGGGGSAKKLKNSPKRTTKMPKLNVSHKRRSSKKFRNMKKKNQLTTTTTTTTTETDNNGMKENLNDSITTNYGDFKKDLSNKHTTNRSTTFELNEHIDNNKNIGTTPTKNKQTPLTVLPHCSRLNLKF